MAAVDEIKRKSSVKRKHRLLKILSSVILLAAISLIAVLLVTSNGKLSVDGLKRLLAGTGGGLQTSSGFSF